MKKLAFFATAIAVLAFNSSIVLADGHGGDGQGHRGKGKMFKAADTDGDGVISKSEFKAHHEKKAEDWFGRLDQDGNGEVTSEEAKEGRKKMRENMKERMEKRKERRDVSQDAE